MNSQPRFKTRVRGEQTRVLVLLVFCILLGTTHSFAATDAGLQQLLTRASRQSDIFFDDAIPFELQADFTAQLRVPTEGHLILKWESKNRYWRRVTIGDFEETEIRNGESVFISRNAPFTPSVVKELNSLLHVFTFSSNTDIKKEKKHTDKPPGVRCVEIRFVKEGKQSHEVCVDSASNDILSNEWEESPDRTRKEEFSEHADFAGHRYPRRLVSLTTGSRSMDVRVTHLEKGALDDALLAPSPGAIVRRRCEGIQHPIPIKTPDPLYPKSSSENQLMGDSSVSMTVLPDGTVDNIQLIGSATRAMDEATLQTLKQWRFKPAMCGNEAVAYDIEVIVSFRLR